MKDLGCNYRRVQEIRNPKSEIRKNSEARSPKSEWGVPRLGSAGVPPAVFGLRPKTSFAQNVKFLMRFFLRAGQSAGRRLERPRRSRSPVSGELLRLGPRNRRQGLSSASSDFGFRPSFGFRISDFGLLPLLLFAIVFNTRAADSPLMASIVSSNTAFAADLYKKESARSGNLFFSPYSISTALAMTYTGARGPTQKEMAQVLHFGQSPEELPEAFAGLAKRMDEIQQAQQVNLSVANALWCQQDYPFSAPFLKLTKEFYDAQAHQVNFRTQTEAVRKEINTWVARKTQDKILDLIHPGQLTDQTRLVLCDAIYFKGNWASRFEAKKTRPAPFFTAPNQPVQVPMMSQTLSLRSKEYPDFYLLAVPYTNDVLSMVILLPKAMDGLGALEKQLDSAKLSEWLTALEAAPAGKADLFLPKFKLDCRLELANDLSEMGMPSAFGPQADFSGMSARRDLFISAVIHQAMVDVNEQGTEAAAATGVAIKSLAIVRNFNPVFRVDHPFLFLLRENQTGSVLFMGRVKDPTK
jgi:serpin B